MQVLPFAENIKYNHEGRSLITYGKSCIIWEKTKSGHLIAGMVSGILSSLLKENIEAEPFHEDCSENYKIIANPKIPKKHIPEIEELKPLNNYNKLNFPQNYKMYSGFKSFTDLLKFKKIKIERRGIFNFQNKKILPSEIGISEIGLRNYLKINEFNLFKNIIIKTSEEIARDILKDEKNTNDEIKTINMMLSAFGWGLPFHKKMENKIIYSFLYPPITKYGSLLRVLILNGYLNKVYRKKFEIERIDNCKMVFSY